MPTWKDGNVNVLPLTSMKPDRKIYPNEVLLPSDASGLPRDSIILCYQIRTLDKKRFIMQIGEVTDESIRRGDKRFLMLSIGNQLKKGFLPVSLFVINLNKYV